MPQRDRDFSHINRVAASFLVTPLMDHAIRPYLGSSNDCMFSGKTWGEPGALDYEINVYRISAEMRERLGNDEDAIKAHLDKQFHAIFGDVFPQGGGYFEEDGWYKLVLPLEAAFNACRESEHEGVRFIMQAQLKAQAQSGPDFGEEALKQEQQFLYQKVLTGNNDGEGPYFPTAALTRLADPVVGKTIEGLIPRVGGQNIVENFRGDAELSQAVAEEIGALGFRRIAYLGQGNSSLAFTGTKDDEGRQQLILITPSGEDRAPLPLLLPEIARKEVQIGEKRFLVRVMPAVEMGRVTKNDFIMLDRLVREAGLKPLIGNSGNEVMLAKNVGIYKYTDKDNREHRLPVILDWGAIVIPKRSEWPAIDAKCKTIAELQPWYAMEEHIRSKNGAKNVMPKEQLERLAYRTTGIPPKGKEQEWTTQVDGHTKRHGKGRLAALIGKEGIYPKEIGDEMDAILKEGPGNPDTYVDRVAAKYSEDPSRKK